MRLNVISFLFFLLISLPSFAQTGSVSGRVTDGESPMPGANVFLEGTTTGTISDLEGQFKIAQLKEGAHILIISFIGYQELRKEITIVAGEDLSLGEISLSAGQVMEEVVVYGMLQNSEAKAINMTKVSNSIVNIIAADGLGKLPDRNAGEAVARVPAIALERDQGEGRYISVRGTPSDWSAALINNDRLPVADELGETRTLAFDIFPSELIEYIIVAKALTPDMEGDAIGASVNFLTRTAPLERTLSLSLAGGVNFQSYGPVINGSLLWADRTKNEKFGYLISGTVFNRSYGTDNYEVIYGSNFNHGLNRLELRDYLGNRRTIGVTLSADYKPSSKTKLYTKLIYGGLEDDEWNRKTMYNWFVGAGQTVRLQNIHNIMRNRLFGGELGANLKLKDNVNLDIRVASYDNKFSYGPVPFDDDDPRNGYHVIQFERFGVTYEDLIYLDANGDITDNPAEAEDVIKLIEDDHPTGGDDYDNIQPIVQQELVPEDFEFTSAYSELNNTWERDPFVGQIDMTYLPHPLFELKLGGKTRLKQGGRELSLHEWLQDYTVTSEAFTLNEYLTEALPEKGGFLEELDEPYQGTFMPFLTKDAFGDFLTNMDGFLRERPMNENHPDFAQWIGARYIYTENVYAGYVMGSYRITEHLSLVGGLRLEQTHLKMEADTIGETYFDFATLTIKKEVLQVNSENKYLAILPMFHLKYTPQKNLNLRFAATRTFRRPNFKESKPGAAVIDFTNLEYTFGNPDLRPSYSWNLDLMFEYFFGNVGLVSAGVFYKYVQDHIFATTTPDADPRTGIVIKSYDNAEKSYVIGVELNINRRLDFLPGFLSGLGINGNYAFIHSEMNVPGRDFSQPLPRQAKHLANLALYYEKSGVQVRLAINYKGPYLMELNLAAVKDQNDELVLVHQDTEYDIYYGAFTSMDFTASYQINDHFQIFTEWNNLLNSPLRIYRGRIERPLQTEYYSIRGLMGFKYNL